MMHTRGFLVCTACSMMEEVRVNDVSDGHCGLVSTVYWTEKVGEGGAGKDTLEHALHEQYQRLQHFLKQRNVSFTSSWFRKQYPLYELGSLDR